MGLPLLAKTPSPLHKVVSVLTSPPLSGAVRIAGDAELLLVVSQGWMSLLQRGEPQMKLTDDFLEKLNPNRNKSC